MEKNKIFFQVGMEFAEFCSANNNKATSTVRIARTGEGEDAYLYASKTEVREYADETLGWIDLRDKNYLDVIYEVEKILLRASSGNYNHENNTYPG